MWASIRAAGAFHADSRRDFFRFYVQIFIFVMVLSCGYKLGAFCGVVVGHALLVV
jgi:hypothetical protein